MVRGMTGVRLAMEPRKCPDSNQTSEKSQTDQYIVIGRVTYLEAQAIQNLLRMHCIEIPQSTYIRRRMERAVAFLITLAEPNKIRKEKGKRKRRTRRTAAQNIGARLEDEKRS